MHGLILELELARLDLREVEDVVDDGEERIGCGADGLDEVRRLRVELLVEQQAGHTDDRVHRRTNLVAHAGQELALGATGRFGRRHHLFFVSDVERSADETARLAIDVSHLRGAAPPADDAGFRLDAKLHEIGLTRREGAFHAFAEQMPIVEVDDLTHDVDVHADARVGDALEGRPRFGSFDHARDEVHLPDPEVGRLLGQLHRFGVCIASLFDRHALDGYSREARERVDDPLFPLGRPSPDAVVHRHNPDNLRLRVAGWRAPAGLETAAHRHVTLGGIPAVRLQCGGVDSMIREGGDAARRALRPDGEPAERFEVLPRQASTGPGHENLLLRIDEQKGARPARNQRLDGFGQGVQNRPECPALCETFEHVALRVEQAHRAFEIRPFARGLLQCRAHQDAADQDRKQRPAHEDDEKARRHGGLPQIGG